MSKPAAMTLFQEAFNTRLGCVRDRFEKRKDAFAKHLAVNAAEAIKSHAEVVSESQYELAAWDYVENAYIRKVGDRFPNFKAAIEAAIETLTQHVLILATEGCSTSDFYNGVKHANLVGTRAAIDELSYLANHPAA